MKEFIEVCDARGETAFFIAAFALLGLATVCNFLVDAIAAWKGITLVEIDAEETD